MNHARLALNHISYRIYKPYIHISLAESKNDIPGTYSFP